MSDTITGLSPKTTYIIKVKARNGDNVETDWLTISSGTATNPDIPLPPTGLTATVNSKSSITLSWYPSEDATSYDILKNNTLITVAASPFEDTGLSPETRYTYQVRANNITGNSTYGSTISAITLPDPPGVPSVLSSSSTTTSIALTWDAVAKATGYKADIDGQISDLGNVATFTHSPLGQGTQHNYRIMAYNSGGDGEWSGQLTASTLLDTPNRKYCRCPIHACRPGYRFNPYLQGKGGKRC